MKRVVHYIGGLGYGGSQAFVMELYRAIDRERVQFDFITFPDQVNASYSTEIRTLGGNIYECPKFSFRKAIEFVAWWRAFLKQHPEYRVIHGHVRSCASIYTVIAHSLHRKVIVHSHSTSNGSGFSAFVKMLLQLPLRYQVDYMFSCSDIAGKWLFGKRAPQKPNYHMIPNCIDCERFAFSYRKREETRMALGIRPDAFVVGHIGRFVHPKNHRFLIDVFIQLLRMDKDAVLVLVGDGELVDSIKMYCNETGIQQHVLFTGNQRNTQDLYAAMDVFCFPSLWEGLPVSVVEAQASGLSCLISDRITQDVLLTDLVDVLPLSDSTEKWAARLMEKKKAIGAARCKVEADKLSKFDSRVVAEELADFYCKIM